jgi:hypothetical protein
LYVPGKAKRKLIPYTTRFIVIPEQRLEMDYVAYVLLLLKIARSLDADFYTSTVTVVVHTRNDFKFLPLSHFALQFSPAHSAANLSGTGYKHNLVFNARQQMGRNLHGCWEKEVDEEMWLDASTPYTYKNIINST